MVRVPKKAGVYKIINIHTNDMYIGATIDLERRNRQHINLLKNNKHPSTYLQIAVNTYNIDAFKFIIICFCDSKELKIKELEYINLYKPKYNSLFVEKGRADRTLNKEICSKKVYQYDLKGNFIKEWESAVSAAKYYNISFSNICGTARGDTKSTINYFWTYKFLGEKMKIDSSKNILLIENNTIIKEWNKLKDCKKDINLSNTQIYTLLNNTAKFRRLDLRYKKDFLN